MSLSWEQVKENLDISEEDKMAIKIEEEIILTMIDIREQKGLTQKQLAKMCRTRQPLIARIESTLHSPRINTLLKILVPMGYTLRVVPLEKHKKN